MVIAKTIALGAPVSHVRSGVITSNDDFCILEVLLVRGVIAVGSVVVVGCAFVYHEVRVVEAVQYHEIP